MSFDLKTFICLATLAGTVVFVTALNGCTSFGNNSANRASSTPETLAYSVGACFFPCPAYSIEVTPSGLVTFEGKSDTAILGKKEHEGGAEAYKIMLKALNRYRPTTGQTVQTKCDKRWTDMPHYRIVWTAADGTQTVLEHDKGCRSTRNDALNKALEALPAKLGIADWAKQETRPGASRG